MPSLHCQCNYQQIVCVRGVHTYTHSLITRHATTIKCSWQASRQLSSQFHTISIVYEQTADCDTMIIPYKVINRTFTTLYGILTGSLSAVYSCASRVSSTVGRLRRLNCAAIYRNDMVLHTYKWKTLTL